MTYEQATKRLNRIERFMATVYAMNSLLLEKKIYPGRDYERLFVEWTAKELRRRARKPARERKRPATKR